MANNTADAIRAAHASDMDLPNMTTTWLTPETAIGCTLPCGAKVVRARRYKDGDIAVTFDSPPISDTGLQTHLCGWWYFRADGTGDCFPPLIPAAPTPQPINVVRERVRDSEVQHPITHAAILAAVERLPEHLDGPAAIAEHLCKELGVEVPVKRPPWEAAYTEWARRPDACVKLDLVWQASWAACEAHHGIMGQEQQP